MLLYQIDFPPASQNLWGEYNVFTLVPSKAEIKTLDFKRGARVHARTDTDLINRHALGCIRVVDGSETEHGTAQLAGVLAADLQPLQKAVLVRVPTIGRRQERERGGERERETTTERADEGRGAGGQEQENQIKRVLFIKVTCFGANNKPSLSPNTQDILTLCAGSVFDPVGCPMP